MSTPKSTPQGDETRKKIKLALPDTIFGVVSSTGITRGTVEHHIGILLKTKVIRKIGTEPGRRDGATRDVFGLTSGEAPKSGGRLHVDSPYKTAWIGGRYPAQPNTLWPGGLVVHQHTTEEAEG